MEVIFTIVFYFFPNSCHTLLSWVFSEKLLSCECHKTPLTVNIGTGNGLVLSENKPLPKPMLTQIYGVSRIQWVNWSSFHCYFLHNVFTYKRDELWILYDVSRVATQIFCVQQCVLAKGHNKNHWEIWPSWNWQPCCGKNDIIYIYIYIQCIILMS